MSSRHVLLVEDSEPDARLYLELLQEKAPDLRVTWFQDGEVALQYIEECGRRGEYPELVLLDLNLPKVSGQDILAVLKADPQHKCVPILVLSASDSPSDISAAYEAGANCYLIKPGDIREINEIVSGILRFWLRRAAVR